MRLVDNAKRMTSRVCVFLLSCPSESVVVLQLLEEEFQVRPNGAVRRRGLPLSEKLLPGEDWRDGVERAIKEELGSVLPSGPMQFMVDDGRHRCLLSVTCSGLSHSKIMLSFWESKMHRA